MPVSRALSLALAWLLAACTSPAAAARAPEEHARAADGVRLAYEQSGSGTPTLVFVHGWCGARGLWRETMAAFAGSHRVLALDLAGHGASGAEREQWSLAVLAGDVVAVCDAAGLRDVILIGHSMGAPVALLAAAELRGRVRGVIGVDSLHDLDFTYAPGFLEDAAAALERDYSAALEASFRSVAGPALARERVDWLLTQAARTDRRAAVGLLRGLAGFDLAAALRGAGVPVRVVNAATHGSGELPTRTERNRSAADFDAALLDSVGHFPMLEQPGPFQALLARWIDELSTSPPPR